MGKDKAYVTLQDATLAAGSGQQLPVLPLVRDDPGLAAIVSKLTVGRVAHQYNPKGELATQQPDVSKLKQISDRSAQNTIDAKTAMQLLPDLELGVQIFIGCVLSPKDLITVEATFSVPEGSLPPEVSGACIDIIKRHTEQTYKIVPLLERILRDSLAETGSYPVAVIPENAIDEMINGQIKPTMESLQLNFLNAKGQLRSVGILGPAIKETPTYSRAVPVLAMEDFSSKPHSHDIDPLVSFKAAYPNDPLPGSMLSVTDNVNVLKMPGLKTCLRDRRFQALSGSVAMESKREQLTLRDLSDRDIVQRLYRTPKGEFEPVVVVKPQDQLYRRTVGQPLVMHIPSEAVIPIYVPGQVENHIGYFVILDGEGNPVSKSDDDDYYQQIQRRINSAGTFASALLQKVKDNIQGFDSGRRLHLDLAVKVFGGMLEKELIARFKNGIGDSNVQISANDAIYRTMLARQLSLKNTQLLFIPATMMTYFAFRYDSNGIGVSLLEDMKILLGMRAMMMFSNMQAAIKNSIGRTRVRIKLDENDPDPQATIERIQHEIVRNRQQMFPVGSNNPVEVLDYLGKAGMEFLIEEHPALPNMSVEFSEENTNYIKPDTDLEEDFRRRSTMKLGLTPEQLDAVNQPELATSVIQNSVLMTKRAMAVQEQLMPMVTNHLRQFVLNSQVVLDELEEVIRTNVDRLVKRELHEASERRKRDPDLPELTEEEVRRNEGSLIYRALREFATTFEVSLPSPSTVTVDSQMEALEKYEKMLDKALESYFNTSMLNADNIGDLATKVDSFREVTKHYWMRKYMAENGIMTELNDLVTTDIDGVPKLDLSADSVAFMKALMRSIDAQAEEIKITRLAYNKREAQRDDVDTTESEIQGSSSAGDYGDSGSDTSSEGDFGDLMGGGGEFDLDASPAVSEQNSSEATEQTDQTSEANPEEKPAQ